MPASGLEVGIEWIIMASRWLWAPLYAGRVLVLAVVVVKFPFKLSWSPTSYGGP